MTEETDYQIAENALNQYRAILNMHNDIIELGGYRHILVTNPDMADNFQYLLSKLFHYFYKKFPHPNTTKNAEQGTDVDKAEVAEVRRFVFMNHNTYMSSSPTKEDIDAIDENASKILWNLPPTVLMTVLPLVIARNALGVQKLPININKTFKSKNITVNGFHEFAKVWIHLIFAA